MSSGVAVARPQFSYASLADAFPTVDPGLVPYGSRVVVQMRLAKARTASGIILPGESRGVEHDMTQVARVVRLGPLAFKNRDSMKAWPEGDWCKPGTYVRVKQYGGDKWGVKVPGTEDYMTFVVFDDLDLIGEITCDPLSVVAYI
jgi:co-chaperonin GroES (HSP10)